MIGRIVAAASLVPALALFALSTGSNEATALLGAVAAAAAVLGGRWTASVAAQRLASGTVFAVGMVAAQFLLIDAAGVTQRGGIGMFYGSAALAVLLSAGMRRLFAAPESGRRPEIAMEALAVVACGMTRIGPVYPLLATAWLILAILSLRTQEATLHPPLEIRRPMALLTIIGLTAAIAVVFGMGLPRLERLAERRIVRWLGSRYSRSGFMDIVRVGSLDRLLQSDRVVLRLWGPSPGYLRGVVYSQYLSGIWAVHGGTHRIRTPSGRPSEPSVEVWLAIESRNYFLPLGGAGVHTERGEALVDGAGTLRPVPGEHPSAYWFVPGSETDAHLASPTNEDLQIPPLLAARLTTLAAEWTAGSPSPRAQMERLTQHLANGFAYDLKTVRPRDADPIEEFLFRTKRGHCQYFASALVLLSRSVGVPARMVGGFRAWEVNPVGGYHVVRERDAHAWAEAWLPGEGWRTFDATPAGAEPRRSSWTFAFLDALSSGAARGLIALRNLTPFETAALLASAVALFAVVRAWNVRRARVAARSTSEEARPPAWFDRLMTALSRTGQVRARSETLERFALRLVTAGLPDVAALLQRYAALRYGGVGDAARLAQEMDACARTRASSNRS